ncbi:MAG: hypothetical protein AB1499_10745, partial [Nitrospirota bacterium]
KNYPGKNATAIQLIKGHTDTLSFTIPNDRIEDLLKLKEHFLAGEISRTTPYRIEESRDLLEAITDREARRKYLCTILKATRGKHTNDDEISTQSRLLMNFSDTDAMITSLLYARFLAGDK